MLLNYYGHNVNPDELNTWLIGQSDGYLSNGLVNWLAVSRYTKLHESPISPALEFTRSVSDNSLLNLNLTNSLGSIIKVPGHFAVVKGKDNDTNDFLVNDPASNTNLTLAQVETDHLGSYSSVYTYTPSLTDLSYILLTVDKNFNLSVLDPNGNPINGSLLNEGPLTDDINNQTTSGQDLNVFMYSKPEDGQYEVNVSGNGQYQLNSYLYDPNGNPIIDGKNGIVSTDNPDNYLITIGEQDNITPVTPTISSLQTDLKYAKSIKLIKATTYTTLNNLLKVAKRYENKHPSLEREVLALFVRYVSVATPYTIDPNTSQLLISQAQLIINTLH